MCHRALSWALAIGVITRSRGALEDEDARVHEDGGVPFRRGRRTGCQQEQPERVVTLLLDFLRQTGAMSSREAKLAACRFLKCAQANFFKISGPSGIATFP